MTLEAQKVELVPLLHRGWLVLCRGVGISRKSLEVDIVSGIIRDNREFFYLLEFGP